MTRQDKTRPPTQEAGPEEAVTLTTEAHSTGENPRDLFTNWRAPRLASAGVIRPPVNELDAWTIAMWQNYPHGDLEDRRPPWAEPTPEELAEIRGIIARSPHTWPLGFDFETNATAALYWASLGFEVKPSGWTQDVFVTRPEHIDTAWSGAHANDGVMSRAPRGTVAVGYRDSALGDHERRLFDPGAPLVWSPYWPHAWTPGEGPTVASTFTVRTQQPGRDALVVKLYAAPALAVPGVHHIPATMLTTPWRREAFELPSLTPWTWASGTLQPLPGHLVRLLDPEPLPCLEQDVKGYPCDVCRRYTNTRPDDYLAPRWQAHVKGVAA